MSVPQTSDGSSRHQLLEINCHTLWSDKLCRASRNSHVYETRYKGKIEDIGESFRHRDGGHLHGRDSHEGESHLT